MERVHLKVKKHECATCGQQFFKKADIKRHLKRKSHHGSIDIGSDIPGYAMLTEALDLLNTAAVQPSAL